MRKKKNITPSNEQMFNVCVPESENDLFVLFQTFRHGFPYQPTAVAFDPVQKLLAIGTKSGSLRMYPFLRRYLQRCHHVPALGSIVWIQSSIRELERACFQKSFLVTRVCSSCFFFSLSLSLLFFFAFKEDPEFRSAERSFIFVYSARSFEI